MVYAMHHVYKDVGGQNVIEHVANVEGMLVVFYQVEFAVQDVELDTVAHNVFNLV